MTPKTSNERRRIGRPPAGAREGEKVKDYPQLSIRLPEDVKATLQALSAIGSRPQWRIVADAIDCYLRERPEAERRMVDELAGRQRAHRPPRRR
jgi:predicted transcriptional regulator